MTRSIKDQQATNELACLLFGIAIVIFSYLYGEAIGTLVFKLNL